MTQPCAVAIDGSSTRSTQPFKMIRFKCCRCGEMHDALPDLGYSAPHYYDANAEDATLTSDLCRVENDYFIRGVLGIPIRASDEFFGYGVWISVSKVNFDRYEQHLSDNTMHVDARFVGFLSNLIPKFPGTLELIGAAIVREQMRPKITLQPSGHPLSVLEQNGIELNELVKIIADYLDC